MVLKKYTYPSVLTVAGYDGSGGAGIQADIKTISALGCYATSVLTALPIQNTCGVKSIYNIPVDAVSEQMNAVLEDILPDAIKIGMVHNNQLIHLISEKLSHFSGIPLVFDPVMLASSGQKLIEDHTLNTFIQRLIPLAHVITPNLDEAAVLAGMNIKTVEHMRKAGERIMLLGCKSVLLKGGHLNGNELTSLYFDQDGRVHTFTFKKIDTNNTHGTGCTLSSAIAAYIARGSSLLEAVEAGQEYVYKAILHGKDVSIGKGKGPLNHFFNPEKLIKKEQVT